MENSQINEAQDEYEAGLEDSQPTTMPSDYELADRISPSEWRHDFADYLMGDTDGELFSLLTYIRIALSYESKGDAGLHLADQELGVLVRRRFTKFLRKTKGQQ